MKFIYKNSAKNFKKPLVITDAIGADKITLYKDKVEVTMDDEYMSDFFDKPVDKLTASDVMDYAEGGLPDLLSDAFGNYNLNLDVNSLVFDTIEV